MAYYQETITDPNTGQSYIIRSNDYDTFQERKNSKLNMFQKRAEMAEKRQIISDGVVEANLLNLHANEEIGSLRTILTSSLSMSFIIDWESLKKHEEFEKFMYTKKEPELDQYLEYLPKKTILEKIFRKLKEKREKEEKQAKEKYSNDLLVHNKEKEEAFRKYNIKKKDFYFFIQKQHDDIDIWKDCFEKDEPEAIEKYLDFVFSKSQYPYFLSISHEVCYLPDRKTIVISIDLPGPEEIPRVLEYKYIRTRNEITKKEFKKREFDELYENTISQITVRTIHEVFSSIYTDSVDFVVFNGFVNSIDKKTGNDIRNCIISVQAEKSYFKSLKLNMVSPKECIIGMRGLIASEFINLAPVRPILNLNKQDRRIIESSDVIDSIDPSNNLAEMDWQKFEVLIRDLFAKEFSGNGVEVKVTQASRDQGVDGIIFDPDPIKGGKFIIQAKRYNNLVGVSAVRDLYGTVVNEGAVKGILVTTSNFGKDSIDFANDKPLTLINGSELVYLFNKHGYKVTIKTKSKST